MCDHIECTILFNDILIELENGKKFSNDFVVKLLEKINNKQNCHKHEFCIHALTLLFTDPNIKISCFKQIIIEKDLFYLIDTLLKATRICINDLNLLKHNGSIESLKKVINYVNYNNDYIDIVFFETLVLILFDMRYEFTKNDMKTIIENCSIEIIKIIFLSNFSLFVSDQSNSNKNSKSIEEGNNFLKIACEERRIDLADFLLKNGFKPAEEYLIIALSHCDYDMINLFVEHGQKLTPRCFMLGVSLFGKKMFDFFVHNHTYVMSSEELFFAIGKRILITKKHKNQLLQTLQFECKKKNSLKTISLLMKEFRIYPDDKCLENACGVDDNYNTVKFLIECGCSVSKKTLTNSNIIRPEWIDLKNILKYIK